jgi:tryptophan synthase alpha chain
MSRISGTFDLLARQGAGAYIPYVCAGDLGNGFTLELIRGLCAVGADVIELGVPFSDPVADGPTIQGAMKRSLDAGFKVADVFEIIRQARSSGIEQPIVLMTYHNPVHKMGVSEFCRRLADAGGDGILVVDLPPEESAELDSAANRHSLDVIRLIAPSTPDERLGMILSKASGFVYAVSVAGVTGERCGLPASAIPLVKRITAGTRLPDALGFGISRPEHARDAHTAGAAGAVEGSGLISIYYPLSSDRAAGLCAVKAHASEMKRAMTPE